MNFLESLQQRGIPFKQSYADTNEITLQCPFCNDSQFRLGVNLRSGFGHCFNGGCDYKSRRAVQTLARKLEMGELSPYVTEAVEAEPQDIALPRDFQLLSTKDNEPLIRKARKYLLERRHVTKEQIKEKGIGVSLTGRFAYRIVFPVMDKDQLVYLAGRDFTDNQEPKYLNSPGPKAVYNVPDKRRGSIVLSEGIFKCLAIERVLGVPSASVLGHTITERQLDMIEGFNGIVLWPDPDEAGLRGFLKLAIRLSDKFKVWLPTRIPRLQADDMVDEDITRIGESFKVFTPRVESKYRKRVLEVVDEQH